MTPFKRCPECQQSKPATTEYFHPRGRNDRTLRTKCKACRNAAARRRAQERRGEPVEDPPPVPSPLPDNGMLLVHDRARGRYVVYEATETIPASSDTAAEHVLAFYQRLGAEIVERGEA